MLSIVLTLWLAAPSQAPPEERFSLPRCAELIDAEASGAHGYECLYAHARTTGEYDVVEALLREHAARVPDNPWPRIKLAAILSDRAKPGVVATYREGVALFEPGDDAHEAMARLNLSTALRHRGDDEEALEELSRARSLAETAKHEPLLQAVTLELARFHAMRGGSTSEIGRLLEEVGEIAPEHHQTNINFMHTRATWLVRLGKADEALAQRRELAEFVRARGDAYVLANTLLAIAGDENRRAETRLKPDIAAYRAQLLEARQAAAEAKHTYAEAEALCMLSELTGPDAVSLARECSEVAARADDASWDTHAAAALAAALRRAGKMEEHRTALAKAIRQAARLGDPELGAAVGEEEVRSAWARLPRAEAIRSTEQVLDRLDARAMDDDGQSIAQRRETWRPTYDFAIGQLLADSPTPAETVTALSIAERQRDDDLLLAEGGGQHGPLDITAAQARVPAGHAIVVFSVANDSSYKSSEFFGGAWAWTVTADSIDVRRLPPRRVLAAKVSALVGALSSGSGGWEPAAAVLREELFGASDWPTGVESLTIVPDRELFELPFAVLLPGVPIDLSTSLWQASRAGLAAEARDRPLALAALGDPAIPAAVLEDRELAPLPFARAEVTAVAEHYGGETAAWTGEAASESEFRRAAAEAGVLHVAAHAYVQSADPGRSALVLAADDAHDGRAGDDHRPPRRQQAAEALLDLGRDRVAGKQRAGRGPVRIA
ncbi:MAG: CHAT domain-containing protein, partial [Myxococcota bacterium]